MSSRLLAIDPGQATGWSLWELPDDGPMERLSYGLIQGGWEGFDEWWESNDIDGIRHIDVDTVVCEDYIPDGRATQIDPNALLIKGYLGGYLGKENVTYQRNAVKITVGDKLLKQHGFWLTGKQVGWKDARDVNDSELHALGWGKINHLSTTKYFWPNK